MVQKRVFLYWRNEFDDEPELVVIASSPEAIAANEHPTVKTMGVEKGRWELVYPPALFTPIEKTSPHFDPKEPDNRAFQSPLRLKGKLKGPLIQLGELRDEPVHVYLDEVKVVEIP